jgi:hypothetical protein
MAKTKSALDPKKWADLKKAWDDYGHSIKFEDLFDYMLREDGYYIVVAWKYGNDEVECADLYFVNGVWDFQNDSGEPMTMEQWKRAKIVPGCDAFDYPSEDEMVDILHEERLKKDKKYAAAFAIYEEGYQAAYGMDNLVEKWMASYAYSKFQK